MHGDEPDNAQSLGEGKGYGPPILPEKIVESYERIRAADPTRPVLLNLGQGVAWDGYYGRGVRTNHPEDYPEYVKGCDIASFDIYPVAHDNAADRREPVVRRPRRRAAQAVGPGQARLELHRVHPHQQQASTRPRRSRCAARCGCRSSTARWD